MEIEAQLECVAVSEMQFSVLITRQDREQGRVDYFVHLTDTAFGH